jgi:hypothetical protein
MWPLVNGIALANRDKIVFCLGSDGSQQEGNDAEAARLAVAQNLNVKVLIDDNNVTIAGHPSEYFKGYDLTKTLEGHGLKVVTVQGEDIDALWAGLAEVINHDGPAAIVAKRIMGPVSISGTYGCGFYTEILTQGLPDVEGTSHAHDVIPVKSALKYFERRGQQPSFAGDILNNIKPSVSQYQYIGSSKEVVANRSVFGEAVNSVLDTLSKEEAARKVLVIDSKFRTRSEARDSPDHFGQVTWRVRPV